MSTQSSNNMSTIPTIYQHQWGVGKRYKRPLLHLTTQEAFLAMRQSNGIVARDPAPNYWAGLTAVFLSDPETLLHAANFEAVRQHVIAKGTSMGLVVLELLVPHMLYSCLDPKRANQVISLSDIAFESGVLLNVYDA